MTEQPTGEPCDRCGRQMEVFRYEDDGTILWQECEDCEVGWSPELGFHELEVARSMSDYTGPPGRDASFSERLQFWYDAIDTILWVGTTALVVAVVAFTIMAVRRQYNTTAEYRGVEPV